MLEGSGLPEFFWSHALYHYTEIHSYLPHHRRDKTPHKIITGNQPDISKLKTFGCRVYVRPPGKHTHKLLNHINKGIFLGCTVTVKNIVYYNLKTHHSKIATHACFNEGMNDLETPTPNAKQLKKALGETLDSKIQETSSPESLNLFSQTSPFTTIVDMNDMPVYTKEDIDKALQVAQDESANNNKPLLRLSIAPDKESSLIQHMPQIQ
eukprot:5699996-Ditylum_brightwellii.AAC.1